MSTFSIIGILFFVVVAVIGISLKIILRNRRKKLDGCHGYVNLTPEKEEEGKTKSWELL